MTNNFHLKSQENGRFCCVFSHVLPVAEFLPRLIIFIWFRCVLSIPLIYTYRYSVVCPVFPVQYCSSPDGATCVFCLYCLTLGLSINDYHFPQLPCHLLCKIYYYYFFNNDEGAIRTSTIKHKRDLFLHHMLLREGLSV